MIEMAVQKQIGKPNLSKHVEQLQQQDEQFKYLSHQ